MKITLYLSNSRREAELRKALFAGFTNHREKVTVVSNVKFTRTARPDVAVFVGVKSRKLFEECRATGVTPLFIDKGYFKRKEYYRVSLGDYQPPYLSEMRYSSSRLNILGVKLFPRQAGGSKVIYAGSSDKYCAFHKLKGAHVLARNICEELNSKLQGTKTVIYRPKPSWWANHIDRHVPLPNKLSLIPPDVEFSGVSESLADILPDAHCLVTHGSNSAIEALCAGIPVILLSDKGISPVYDLCGHNLTDVLEPFWPNESARLQVMSNLAHCQFTIVEMANGIMWSELKKWYGYKTK